MSDSKTKIEIDDVRDGVGACGWLIIGISFAIFLFDGKPDIHDLCIEWLRLATKAAP